MRKGLLAGGITLTILGIIILIPSLVVHGMVNDAAVRCSGLVGQIGQALSNNTQNTCMQVSMIQNITVGTIALAGIFVLIGIPLTIIGAVKDAKPKVNAEPDQVQTKKQTKSDFSNMWGSLSHSMDKEEGK